MLVFYIFKHFSDFNYDKPSNPFVITYNNLHDMDENKIS